MLSASRGFLPVPAVRLAALATRFARAVAVVPEITAVVLLALAVATLAGDLALGALIHCRKAAPGGPGGLHRAGFQAEWVALGIVLAVVCSTLVGIIVGHTDLLASRAWSLIQQE